MAASHILVAWDDPRGSILQAWTVALMAVVANEQTSFTPFTARQSLYDNPAIYIPGATGRPMSHDDEDTVAALRHYSTSSFSWSYTVDPATTAVCSLAEYFVQSFLDQLKSSPLDPQLKAVWSDFGLLIIPFYRHDTDPVLSDPPSQTRAPQSLQPAGAVLLAIQSKRGPLADRPDLHDSLEGLRLELQAALRKVALDEAYSYSRIIVDRVAQGNKLGHLLKTIVSMTGWEQSYDELRELMKKANGEDRYVLRNAVRSLSLFVVAQGMGELLRLLGLLERGEAEDNQKLKDDWIDVNLLNAWCQGDNARVGPLFEELIVAVARALCQGQNWPKMEIYRGEEQHPFLVWNITNDLTVEALNLRQLRCPPFKKDSPAVTILVSALAEPIRNALIYLAQHPELESTPLKLRLTCHLPDIRVQIGNRIAPGYRPGLSQGIRITQAVLSQVHFATFEDPIVVSEPDSTDTYWLPIRLHPDRLAAHIMGVRRNENNST